MKVDTTTAVKLLKAGQLVALPTETVYGLAADATNAEACQKIFALKQRPSFNPLIVHVANINQAKKIAILNEPALLLAKKFWPGPLTMILPQRHPNNIAATVTAGLATIAVRIPAEPHFQKVLQQARLPIAAPSANISGRLSPTKFEHVKANFGQELAILLSQAESENIAYVNFTGLESTIIDLTSANPTILRFGAITPIQINDILAVKVQLPTADAAIKAPGMLLKHYAPKTKLRIHATTTSTSQEAALNFGDSQLTGKIERNLSPAGDLAEAARNLYNYLYELDNYCQQHNINQIAVAPIPSINIGLAINDRLARASNN